VPLEGDPKRQKPTQQNSGRFRSALYSANAQQSRYFKRGMISVAVVGEAVVTIKQTPSMAPEF
jgi:hypothetical protein